MQYKLKSISQAGIGEANSKAEFYRLLNEPEETESICKDVLAVEPENQDARRILGLAISDETGGPTGTTTEFQYGKITWSPLAGAKIIWADGHGPGKLAGDDLPQPVRRPGGQDQRPGCRCLPDGVRQDRSRSGHGLGLAAPGEGRTGVRGRLRGLEASRVLGPRR